MHNYYFVIPSLPPLSFEEPPQISSEELFYRLDTNLSQEDLSLVKKMRLYADLTNIQALLQEEAIDPRGNLDEQELDSAILSKEILPQYVFDFLDQYDSIEAKLRHFSGLFSIFFAEESEHNSGFLKRFFSFERELRLMLTAMRAQRLKRSVSQELLFEDPKDPFVMAILVQKDSESYEFPHEYSDLKEVIEGCDRNPLTQHQAIARYRFKKIEEMEGLDVFSMDSILSFIARLDIVEKWFELDEKKGEGILQSCIPQ